MIISAVLKTKHKALYMLGNQCITELHHQTIMFCLSETYHTVFT
jgi:hypothetical protein